MPLSQNPHITSELGTRHRAGIGISEEADVIVVIVSEETGNISIAYKGLLTRGLNEETMKSRLEELLGSYSKKQNPGMFKNIFYKKGEVALNKIFANNTLLKILSFIIAIVLWAYIIIIIDAPTEKTFRDVPITTVNEQVISDRGYSIEKLSVQTSSVKIEGSRKVIAKFDSSNIIAKLDFSDVNASKLTSEGVITVNLSVSSEFGDIVSFTPSAVDVHVESTKYKDVDIKYTHSGDVMDGYVSGDISLSQDKIRVFGAQSNIDNVSYASVNIDFINTDYSAYIDGKLKQDCQVKLFDSNGKELTEKDKRWIWNNTPVIQAECPLYKVKSVKVVPNADYTLSGVTLKCEPGEIKIYGDNNSIENYSQIQTEPVTLSSFENGHEITSKLVLPSWAKTVDNVSEVKISANSN